VFLLALVARIAAQLVLGAYGHPVTWEYEDIANSILSGHGYTYMVGDTPYVAAVSSPLYVLLTVAVYFLTGHSFAVMLALGALFGAATATLAAWLAGRSFGTEAAWASGTLVAIDPGMLVYAAELHPLTLDALAFLSVICACIALPRPPRARHGAVLGALLGVAALTRTTVLALVPVVLLWAKGFRGLRLVSVTAIAFVGVALIVYSPWPIRNSLLLHQFVPVSSESTEWLWRGTNPNATGGSLTPEGRTMIDVAPPEFRARIGAASEAERIVLYRDAAVTYMAQHPIDALRLYLTKLKAFWCGSESTGVTYPAAWTLLYFAWYEVMLVLAAAGVWRAAASRASRDLAVLIVSSLSLISASQALFYVEGRHRLAVEPLLLVMAGCGLSLLAAPAYRYFMRRARSVAPSTP
jgi:4-amino-4-deoxy-L-arabinose transferase-like glycosyltransferase